MTNNATKATLASLNLTAHDITDKAVFCLQPKGKGKDVWTQDYLDLEAYIRVKLDDVSSFKIPPALFNDELSDAAFRNTRENLKITTMAEILGLPATLFEPMDVITNKDMMFGASALLFPDIFKEYCEQKGIQKIYILPSSIHELIVVPQDLAGSSVMTNMVQDVNSNEVLPEDVLSNHVYLYDVTTNQITY